DLAEHLGFVRGGDDLRVRALVRRDDQAVAGRVQGERRHAKAAVEADEAVEVCGGLAVGRECWARVQSADVLLEIEPSLRVERLHFRPIRRRSESTRLNS